MKKTLIAILALSSLAMADAQIDWTLTTGQYTGAIAKAGGKGIIFQVADNDRMDLTSTISSQTPTSFVLDSISLWSRDDQGIGQGCIYLTDDTNTIIAFSDLNNGVALGNNKITYTFNTVSDIFSDKTADNHQNQLTLNAGGTYKLFWLQGNASTVSGYAKSYVGNTLTGEFQNDINEAVVYVTGATTASKAQCGQLTGLDSVYNGSWAPLVEVKMHSMPITPEPATATLSLLALAGLAARRRRH